MWKKNVVISFTLQCHCVVFFFKNWFFWKFIMVILMLRVLSLHLFCETWVTYMEALKELTYIWRQLIPLNYMISFKSSIIGVICNTCKIPNYLHLSWYGKVYFNIWRGSLWMIIMSLNMPLRSGTYIGRLTMCLLPKYLFIL